MQVTARARFQRGAASKARLILPPLRGMAAEEAITRLRLAPQTAAHSVSKLIASAVADAEHNHSLDKRSLVIDRLTADQGPSYKRYRPRARGASATVRRPTMHLTVVLEDRLGESAKNTAKATKTSKARKTKTAAQKVVKKVAKAAPKGESRVKSAQATKVKPKDMQPKKGSVASGKPVAPRKTDRQTGQNPKSTSQGKGT